LPTYAYRCADCAHRFEAVQSFTDDALTVCPVCNGTLRKVFNAVGVVFKGSGFYRTDSRAAATSSSSKSSGSDGSDGKGSETNGSDRSGSGSTNNGSGTNGSGAKSGDSGGASSKSPAGEGSKAAAS
jgi:putative FmdB family regulatory protein